MNDGTDPQLLRTYAESRSEAAFAELVRRHVDFVYSAALRMVCDSHLAEDVTQGVFVAFAKNAAQLTNRRVLSGWLHRTAQNIAAQTVRTIERRRAREQEAVAMNELLSAEPETVWEHIAPDLDEALGELNEGDRDALLLRYFERKSARAMAQTLGVSEDAAQKRVSRAVERLREFFAKRGITVGASGLVVVISANAVQAAPVGLAVTISTAAALAGTTLATTAISTATKAIAMTTLQKTLIAATIVVAVGTGLYKARQAAQLREQNQTLQQQQAPLAEQIQQLQRERDAATQQLAALRDDNERLNRNAAELLKLRGQVGRLRTDSQELAQLRAAGAGNANAKANDPIESAAKDWLAKVKQLKQLQEQMPDKKIPELQYLKDQDWLSIVKNPNLDLDADVSKALSDLRDLAKQQFAKAVREALRNFVKANGGQLPTDVSQLKPYFQSPLDDGVLQRYQMLKTGNVSDLQPRDLVVAEKAPVDDQYDTLFQIGLNGWASHGTAKNSDSTGAVWSVPSAP